MLTVCFVGLPQAGKSSMLNALAGKHLLRTGACRTTTEPALIARDPAFGLAWHESELASDDGVELRAIDLPGITDAENEGGTFDAMALEWAKRCDVVCWVSDVRTAFLTTHEKSEWHSLKAALQRKADFDGSLYQTCVVLTKCDVDTVGAEGPNDKKETRRGVGGELECDDEETTIEDCVARVSRVLGDERVVRFFRFRLSFFSFVLLSFVLLSFFLFSSFFFQRLNTTRKRVWGFCFFVFGGFVLWTPAAPHDYLYPGSFFALVFGFGSFFSPRKKKECSSLGSSVSRAPVSRPSSTPSWGSASCNPACAGQPRSLPSWAPRPQAPVSPEPREWTSPTRERS
jgi:GTPase SAR1 family protein